MRTNPVQQINPLTFQYNSILKDEFKRGAIKLTKDITGKPINKKNVSLDHTIPKSKGGKSNIFNYSIMDRISNMQRSNKPIEKSIDLQSLIEYIIVMMDVKTEDFDGIKYLKGWLRTLNRAIKEKK